MVDNLITKMHYQSHKHAQKEGMNLLLMRLAKRRA